MKSSFVDVFASSLRATDAPSRFVDLVMICLLTKVPSLQKVHVDRVRTGSADSNQPTVGRDRDRKAEVGVGPTGGRGRRRDPTTR